MDHRVEAQAAVVAAEGAVELHPALATANCTIFMTGPSATADIEGVLIHDRDPQAQPQHLEMAREKAHRAPLLMMAVARLDESDREVPAPERWISLDCAIQNLLLAAHAMGCGSALTSGQAIASPRLHALFALGVGEVPVRFVNVGTVGARKPMRTEIWLNDGTLTPLSQKGDGVKSLVAIALAKASAEGSAGDRNLILAIEEPEAHLHSGAVHILKALLEEIALTRQVIISTHEPALVRRDNVGANVLVQGNMAKPADSLDEVRRVLGVQLAENLVSPDLVLLVEGPGDGRLLNARIKALEPKLHQAIASGRLRLQPLHGAGNLAHQLRFYQALVCSAVAFVDHDSDGVAALTRARKDGLLDINAEFCANKPGHPESELEDLLDPTVYAAELCSHLGVTSLKPKAAKAAKLKWSARLEVVLAESGKPKTDHERLIREAKFKVNELAVESAATCFIPALTGPIDGLIASLKSKLGIAHLTEPA